MVVVHVLLLMTLADFENAKVPAVVIKKKKPTSVPKKKSDLTTQCSERRDSDSIESEPLL